MKPELKRYKLLIITSHPVNYAVELYKSIATHPGIDVKVLFEYDYGIREVYDKISGKKINWYEESIVNGLPHKFIERENHNRLTSFINIFKSTVREIIENNYDAALVQGYTSTAFLAAYFSIRFRRTKLLLRGATEPFTKRNLLKRIIKQIILRPIFKGVDAFLCDCSLNAEIFKKYGAKEEQIYMLPSAVDNKYFQNKAGKLKNKKAIKKKKYGFPQNKKIILFLNKLIERKRPMDLMHAYEKIRKKINCCLVYVGDGWERKILEEYIKQKKIRDVYFEGLKRPDEVSEYYSVADIFVLPSRDDASPKSLNEAMNFGLPVIVTNTTGTAPELVENEGNGYVYEPGDVFTLSEHLLNILSDRKKAKRMGKRSIEIVSEYNFDRGLKGLISALEYICK